MTNAAGACKKISTRYLCGMTNTRLLLDRMARLMQAGAWARGLNPAQASALAYLARANRFSRSPSHVADYLGTTRGTASQTLQALARKGLVQADASGADRRSVSYRVTAQGRAADETEAPPPGLSSPEQATLDHLLERMARGLTAGGRSFGLCASCTYHRPGPACALMQIALAPEEAHQLCHEHQPAG
jgi:DNA-binding MarR family transcriptional regulator